MMGFKFEDYINGNLPEPERRALEQRLAADPALRAQLEEEEALLARLKRQMLREQVEAAMREGRETDSARTPSRWWFWGALAILLAVFLAWWVLGRSAPGSLEAEPELEQPAGPPEEKEEILQAEQLPPAQEPHLPIAQRDASSPAEDPPRSGLRGAGETPAAGPAAEVVRQLQLPVAVEAVPLPFQPAAELARKGRYRQAGEALSLLEQEGMAGDTLAFLRAFCLLKQENGLEAARYFVRLEASGGALAEEAQWGLALSWLLAGQEAWAEEQLQAVIGQPGHPRATAAAGLLRELTADQ